MAEWSKARFLVGRVKNELLKAYQHDPNIMGAGFGRRIVRGQITNEPALVVYVIRKVPKPFIPLSNILPRRVYMGENRVEVDVVETGPFYMQLFTAKERPVPSGISIGHTAIGAGTLGCLVRDKTDGSLCILSNNHVLVNQNVAMIGDVIVQPGAGDGGLSPADDIAKLKRFVTIKPTGNVVDAAIAQVINPADVVDQMKNNLMPVPNPNHPAVGMLFAGSCNRAVMNPIREVLSQLDIEFLAGAGSIVDADIGMNVEKVGRTTEYTTSTITEIDVTLTVPYDFGLATFEKQFATAWMSEDGDSGSIVCQGGKGGYEDHCGCWTTSAAAKILGIDPQDMKIDVALEKEFRQKYLSQTLIGRAAIELFFRHEARLVERVRAAKLSQSDQAFAHNLYRKYYQEVRMALLQPNRPDMRLTAEHLREAREALTRAVQYMSKEEAEVAQKLFELALQTEGKNLREILAMLNDKELFEQVVKIVSTVQDIEDL